MVAKAKKVHDHALDAAGYQTSWLDFVAEAAARNGGLLVEGTIEARMLREGSIRIQECGKPDRYVPLELNHDYVDPTMGCLLPEPELCFYCLRERDGASTCRGCGGVHFLTKSALRARRSCQ